MTLPQYVKSWLQDPRGGLAWRTIRKEIQEHEPDCESIQYAWLPRTGVASSTYRVEDCQDCQLTVRMEGIKLYELDIHGKRHDLYLCGCCYRRRLQEDTERLYAHDAIASSRFFRWQRGTYDLPWWQFWTRGNEENCNKTLGVSTPWGLIFVCLNMPLRQKPCKKCRRMM